MSFHLPAIGERVMIAGAGPSGMTAALQLAGHGIDTVVFEAYGRVASRGNLLNFAPSTIDEFAHAGATRLVEQLSPIRSAKSTDLIAGTGGTREYAAHLQPDPSRATGEFANLLKGLRGEDGRTWGRMMIGGCENLLRMDAEETGRFSRHIDILYNTKVVDMSDDGRTARVVVEGKDGVRQAFEGTLLIPATGGRSGLPGVAKGEGHTMYFAGMDFAASDATRTEVHRALGTGEDFTTPGAAHMTIGLHNDAAGGHSLLWAQIPRDAREFPQDELRAALQRRARLVGLDGEPAGNRGIIPVPVQLGMGNNYVTGRIIPIGDEWQVPYFPNSTGANAGVLSARNATDLVHELFTAPNERAAAEAIASYRELAHANNKALYDLNLESMNRALDADPSTPHVDLIAP